jgi:hypothetical protein
MAVREGGGETGIIAWEMHEFVSAHFFKSLEYGDYETTTD